MRKKLIFSIFIALIFLIIYVINMLPKEEVQAASGGSNSDIQLLARAINGEARGEPYEGQVAIGAVILNRVKDSRFPNTIAGVIYQSGAFSSISDGQLPNMLLQLLGAKLYAVTFLKLPHPKNICEYF